MLSTLVSEARQVLTIEQLGAMSEADLRAAVSRMTPVQRRKVARAATELRRRKTEERSRYFVPTDPSIITEFGLPANDQRAFIYSTSDERYVFGGNRSGKTECCVQDCVMFCTGKHPVRSSHRKPPVKVRYCAPKWEANVEAVLLGKFQEIVRRSDLRGGSWKTAWSQKAGKLHFKNKSWIQFKSGEQDLDTFMGIDLDAVYQDEHMDKPRTEKNWARLTDRNGFFVWSMTPEFGVTWQRDHVENPPKEDIAIAYWFFKTEGNPHLSPEGVRKIKARIKDPQLARAMLHGEFISLQGLVIPQFDLPKTVIPDRDVHPDSYRVFCIDMHTRTPSAAMWAAWEPDGKLIVYRCLKVFRDVPAWQAKIRSFPDVQHIDLWLGDEPGRGEGTDINNKLSLVEQMNDGPNGLPLEQVGKPQGSFYAGIVKLWHLFKVDPITHEPLIQIMKSCLHPVLLHNGTYHGHLAWELEQYEYKKKQKADEEALRENVRTVNDHYISDLRYIAMAGPGKLQKDDYDPQDDMPDEDNSIYTHTEAAEGW